MITTRSTPSRIVAIVATLVAIALGLLLFGRPLPAQGNTDETTRRIPCVRFSL